MDLNQDLQKEINKLTQLLLEKDGIIRDQREQIEQLIQQSKQTFLKDYSGIYSNSTITYNPLSHRELQVGSLSPSLKRKTVTD